ncbi:PIR Superfamily Protein [Plasmodium malariae]|uniref:PIR Superfamily Protein n=1 Tax=Plasmodium malariae TaxID=5858 RepID=A0A1A8WSK9_PLAMA|nr:PIR Superfamily Protein [Plasmodium malariae]
MENSEDNDMEYILKKLPEYKNFNNFQENAVTSENDKYCETLNNDGSSDTEVKTLCKTIVSYLSNIKSKKVEINNYDFCPYFTYWIYKKIKEKFKTVCKNNFEKCDIYRIYNIIPYVYDNLMNKSCIFYFNGNFDEWKEEIYLNYYFKICDGIEKNKLCVGKDKDKCCKYFNYIEKIYEKHIRKCCTYYYSGNNSNDCTTYIKCEEKYNPYNLLTKLSCSHSLPYDYPKVLRENLIIDRDVIIQTMNSFKMTINDLINDPFYKGITFGFMVIGVSRCVKSKNKDKFVDSTGYLEGFYDGKDRNINCEDRKICVSYYSI